MTRYGIFVHFLMVLFATSFYNGFVNGFDANSYPGLSISLLPDSAVFDISKVPQGAVGFTAQITNNEPFPLIIAHPSICFPADHKQGESIRIEDFHGKSELLVIITKPNGTKIILRDGFYGYFNPGNIPILRIPPQGITTFKIGWFFQNARGRWEHNDEAARVFLAKGVYRIQIRFRNSFPKAALYDSITRETIFADVWTGDMISDEISIEIK